MLKNSEIANQAFSLVVMASVAFILICFGLSMLFTWPKKMRGAVDSRLSAIEAGLSANAQAIEENMDKIKKVEADLDEHIKAKNKKIGGKNEPNPQMHNHEQQRLLRKSKRRPC